MPGPAEREPAGRPQVFGVVLPAFGFNGIFEAVPPVGLSLEGADVGHQRAKVVPLVDGDAVALDFGPEVRPPLMPQRMEIAQTQQRLQVELERPGPPLDGAGVDRVSHGGGVAAPRQLQLLRDGRAFDFIIPPGDMIERELRQVPLAARVDRVGKLIHAELVPDALEGDSFADAVDGHHAPDRRQQGGDEQPVVPAGVHADDRGRRERAEPVGQQPFLFVVWFQLAVGLDR